MKLTNNLLLLGLAISLSRSDRILIDAWAPPPPPWSMDTKARTPIAIIKRKQMNRRVAFVWESSGNVHQTTNVIRVSSQKSCTSSSSLRISNGDDYEATNREEGEFYQEYENMYDSGKRADEGNPITNKTRQNKQQQQQQQQQKNTPSPPTKAASNKNTKKIEVAKAWDELMLEESMKTTSASDNNGDGDIEISNLSDLQQRLRQIQNRNKEPLKEFDIGQREDSDTFPSGRIGKKQNFGEEKRKPESAAEELSGRERYLDILRKAEERLSEMKSSSAGSDFKADTGRRRMVSNMAGLQERLNQIQRDTSLDTIAGTESSSSEDLPNAKILEDNTLAEWEELENQLQREAAERMRQKTPPRASTIDEVSGEISTADEAAILDALRSQAAFSNPNDNDNDNDSNKPSYREAEDDLASNDIPASYKKYMTDYEVTEDGGVFLSPKAYQEACNNANPDGSLNFDGGSSDDDSDSQTQTSSSLKSSFVEKEPPMAPYEQGTRDSSGTSKPFTIRDLTREASRSIGYARDNPDVQEELHRRIMAEFEAEEAIYNGFEKEILIDPEKANAFWNQEYFEQQKEESNALDRLLDQKLKQLEEEQQEEKNRSSNSSSSSREFRNEDLPAQLSEAQKQQYMTDRNIFFASREERIDRRRMIHRNRKNRAKTIAKFYRDVGDDSSWNLTSESKEVERITERRDKLRGSIGDNREKVSSSASMDSLESNKDLNTSIQKRNVQDHSTNNNNSSISEKNGPEMNQEQSHEGQWVLVEDPESPEDVFYWNELTGEMRWDPPQDV
eukprot:jgi/Psemu1/67921/estExt_Genemark1.C_3940036